MSKKQLPTAEITDELAGASKFFDPPALAVPTQTKEVPSALRDEPLTDFLPLSVSSLKEEKNNDKVGSTSLPALMHASMQARMHARKKARKPASGIFIPPKINQDDPIETIRKTVKQVGKILLYLRVTSEEKQRLSSIVYAFNDMYRGEGRKTSENEVSRIALNWLMEDYQANGENSVLAQVLASLNA
jgi:hypothetical protein